jgi:hypothetical protein
MAFFTASSPDVYLRRLFIMLSRILLELPLPCPTQLSGIVLARPKSQILMLQSASIRILAGFKSL